MTRAHHSPPLRFDTLDQVVEAVRAGGGRLSLPRRMVLETLFASRGAAARGGDRPAAWALDLTSVYRNLEALEALGAVRHVHLGHGPGLYALVGRGSREYLVCEICDGHRGRPGLEVRAVRASSTSTRASATSRSSASAGVPDTLGSMEEHEHTHPHATSTRTTARRTSTPTPSTTTTTSSTSTSTPTATSPTRIRTCTRKASSTTTRTITERRPPPPGRS